MQTMPANPKTKTQPAKASSSLGKAAKAAKPAKKPAAKAAVKAAPTVKRKTTSPKKAASTTTKASKPKATASPSSSISTDDIALRAYYIAERRRSMGWGGDEHSDWVEAESQLKAEAKRKRLRE